MFATEKDDNIGKLSYSEKETVIEEIEKEVKLPITYNVLDREFSNKFLCGIIIIINVVVITIEKR